MSNTQKYVVALVLAIVMTGCLWLLAQPFLIPDLPLILLLLWFPVYIIGGFLLLFIVLAIVWSMPGIQASLEHVFQE